MSGYESLSDFKTALEPFQLTDQVAVITGGAGLLGENHAQAIARAGGIPILVDIRLDIAKAKAEELTRQFGVLSFAFGADITQPDDVERLLAEVLSRFGRLDILINNAAKDPKVESGSDVPWSRVENFPLEQWHDDLAVGLTGAFICCKTLGSEMARQGRGVILNIASDLGVIAPDQRIYRRDGLDDSQQPVKPVTYSIVKTGLVGLTRYLATYWAESGVRVNAISPGGVYNDQPEDFVQKLTNLIPMKRMARKDEYQSAILFLCSDASSYMTGHNLVIDGGRTAW